MSNNPFMKYTEQGIGYIDSSCSINKLIIAQVPVKGIADEIEGKAVSEIFSTAAITKRALKDRQLLKVSPEVPEGELPFILMSSADSTDPQVKQAALNIANDFGSRLGLILLTLKTALPKNRLARPDWKEEHWRYWQNLKTIFIVGGLTYGGFGAKLIERTKQVCQINGSTAYEIRAFENAAYIGVMGCTRLLKESNGINVLMDFGQTNMKRSIVTRQNGEVVSVKNLPLMRSKYMQWNIPDETEREKQAKLLHRYIMSAITDAYKKAESMGSVGSEIVISIASYTHNGVLDTKRGGYSKLSVLYKNYGEYLSEELSGVLKRPIKVTLVHDGTAVALNFINYPDSVCLTLGTFFGVGFTDIWQTLT